MEITHDSSQSDEEPFDMVDCWFIGPIRALRDSRNKDSDGAFLALSASCAMYERFLIKLAQSRKEGPGTTRNELGGEDLGIGENNFKIFWECFRDGLQHQFQPTKERNKKTYYWSVSDEHDGVPNIIKEDERKFTIQINPWKFAEFVNQRYTDNPDFWLSARSHKPGTVQPLDVSPQNLQPPPDGLPKRPQTTDQILNFQTGHFHKGQEREHHKED